MDEEFLNTGMRVTLHVCVYGRWTAHKENNYATEVGD